MDNANNCPQATWKSYISLLIVVLSIPTFIALACLMHFIRGTFLGVSMKTMDDQTSVPIGSYNCVALLDPNQNLEMVSASSKIVLAYQILVLLFFLLSIFIYMRSDKKSSSLVFALDIINVGMSIYSIVVLSLFVHRFSTRVKIITDEKSNEYQCIMFDSEHHAQTNKNLMYAVLIMCAIQLMYFIIHINSKKYPTEEVSN